MLICSSDRQVKKCVSVDSSDLKQLWFEVRNNLRSNGRKHSSPKTCKLIWFHTAWTFNGEPPGLGALNVGNFKLIQSISWGSQDNAPDTKKKFTRLYGKTDHSREDDPYFPSLIHWHSLDSVHSLIFVSRNDSNPISDSESPVYRTLNIATCNQIHIFLYRCIACIPDKTSVHVTLQLSEKPPRQCHQSYREYNCHFCPLD